MSSQNARLWWQKWRWYERNSLPWNRLRIHRELARRRAFARWPLHGNVLEAFRDGRLEIGEASIIIVAASPHRGEAFAACRYMIERVKQIVPIWKHEHFEGGDVWLEGATADPDDEAARDKARRIACA